MVVGMVMMVEVMVVGMMEGTIVVRMTWRDGDGGGGDCSEGDGGRNACRGGVMAVVMTETVETIVVWECFFL